ncbi:MAG: primosomal protein N' [Patescibacteria group bacterium]
MFIIECLPFSKGLNKESLSYFSAKNLEPGSLIKINIRSKSVNALVLESRDAVEIKSEIKSASFQLKKISAITAKPFLQKNFLDAVKTTAEYFATTSGNVLPHLIPSFILENSNLLSLSKGTFWDRDSLKVPFDSFDSNKETKSEVAALQAPDEERFIHYRSLIREEFAKGKSIFLCLPQNEDIKQTKEKLERGIESFVSVFHNDLTKKDLKKEWEKACLTPHPILIIATSKWLFLPRNDLGTIILDKENSDGWKTLFRPFMDLRFFTETLADKKNIRLVIGDSFLRTETLYRYKQGEATEFENIKWRLPKEVTTSVSDLRQINKKDKEFKTLSPELINLINKTIENESRMFIFAARKGLSSITVCRDCGEQVKCNNCLAPMVLYKTNNGGAFKCHQCGETRDAAEICQNCHSWKLAAFGSGIDRVTEEIRKNFPEAKIFEIYKDIAPTSAKALKIMKNFYENRGSILLGTEMAFPYLYKKVANSAIASFDSLFSIPDFRIREKIFRIILQTRNIAKENFLIQTRNPDDSTVEFAINGNLMEFYKKEIKDRQVLNYPPFGIFIKIITRGTKIFVLRESEKLKNILKDYNPAVFNSIHEKKGEQSAINIVIKLPKENWPEPTLLSILKSLPSHFEIKIDPDNLL